MELRHTIKLIQILDEEIGEIEERIQNHMQEIHSLLESIPGISTRLAAYLKKKRDEGKHYFVALSHVAKKLVRVIFHLQKTGGSFSDFA